MDIKNRVMGDQPNDFFHKIAGIIPGYHGYTDRERRRDADKILRTTLAHQFTEQRDRLTRVQQGLLRGHHLEEIAEIDRLAGALQRFTDRLSMATYGYSGLFDPIKVEAADLDQLYAFDMALASGVDQVSTAIDAVDAAATSGTGAGTGMPELPPAITRLSSLLDELNQRLNERADLLTSGKRLPDNDYRAMVSNFNQPTIPSAASDMAADTGSDMSRYSPGSTNMSTEGTPTTSLNMSAPGIETASSPVGHPAAPGHGIGQGLDMTTGSGLGSATEGIDTGASLGNPAQMNMTPDNPKP